jgi:DNA-directed RNA polymerase specialized sigma24 family protein
MEDKLMEEHNSKYTLVVNKKRIPVTEEVYKAYYQQKEREVYLDKLSAQYNLSFEECEEKGVQVEYLIASVDDSLENTIITKEMIAKILDCLNLLDSHERQLIEDLFYSGKSERILSAETGIPPMTIHDRKCRILKKLKKLMKI